MRIQSRFILLIILIIFLGLGIGAAFLVQRIMFENLHTKLKEKGLLITGALAGQVTHNVVIGRILPVREALLEKVRTSQLVEYVYILGLEKEIFTHSFEEGFPKALINENKDTLDIDTQILTGYMTPQGPILEVAYPLIKGLAGRMHVGLNMSYAHRRAVAWRNRILALTIFAMLLGIGLAAAVNRRPMKN